MYPKIPLEYCIIIPRFNEVFNRKMKCFDSIHSALRDEKTIISVIKELIPETFKNKPSFYFSDYNHPYFLQCLTNYLAIIDNKEIKPILEYYFTLYSGDKRQEMLDYLQGKYLLVMNDYLRCFPQIPVKQKIVEDCIVKFKTTIKKVIKSEEPEIVLIFNLTVDERIKIVDAFEAKNIIDKEDKFSVTQFFNNQLSHIQLRVGKNIIMDLLDRLIFKRETPAAYTQKEITYHLADKISYQRNQKYFLMNAKSLKKGFDNGKMPKKYNKSRLLLNEFPDYSKNDY